ncbi:MULTISPECIES: CAP domain-containing protein [unclassified Streptomyces]|uniref:CAP domain-containing protein n=1 Tax=unclassified Streptomyces TaxID=2593676 RepID=UPI0034188E4F
MGKHRKNTQYRRIVIAAVAVGSVGIPSAAMACTNWPGSGGHRSDSAGNSAAKDSWDEKGWWNDAGWGRPWTTDQAGGPSRTASAAPSATKTPSASANATKAPKASANATKTAHHAPARAGKTTASPSPRPRITTTAPAATASAAPKPSSTPKATATASGVVARIVALVNAERGKVGCQALTLNTTLTKVAQAHSEDMALHQNMSHSGSDGSSPGDRITAAGYTWSAYGENVAYGYATPEQVMAGWMASPGHKANILNCSFKEIGVGLAQPGSYWTQDFATAR